MAPSSVIPPSALSSEVLRFLVARQEIAEEMLRPLLREIMSGRCGEAEIAGFLIAMRMKGETARELATAAQVLREHMIRWEPGREDVVDTCGTGGDGLETFNISTATAFVLAGAGVPVVKHGNRSVSSRSGSADVLGELGVSLGSEPDFLRRCLSEANLAFCFAPSFHPAMKHVAGVRRSLGIPTLFNSLGPLANPAGARRQLLGVGRPELLDLMSGALGLLGTTRAFVVRSDDGLDEVSLGAATQVRVVTSGEVKSQRWTPEDFGLAPVELSEVKVSDSKSSARVIERMLQGEESPAQRLVLANASAGLLLADRVPTLRDGVALARETLRSGRAYDALQRLRVLKPAGD